MKRLVVLAVAAVLVSGCSPLLYPGQHSHYSRLRPGMDLLDRSLPIGRWDNVMRLPRPAIIDVLTLDGTANVGEITGADGQNVRVRIDGVEVRIPRSDVVRIDLVELPGSQAGAVAKGAAGGALLGAGMMTLVAGVIGGQAWPPPASLLRAGAASGAVSGGHAAIVRRQPRMIYLAPRQ